ncbi:hypothetical protein BXZ70DRAFT_1079193 [Cristinia sonorae]|uniref:Uncharacterized protein n=1 Tax=Cristinia sonorae TaxID=1940300 RepID=A0A8K0UIN8_9AGAR|nr:hypothetical protein BXZ70DRAFT_1079193 [Cristinia sonorae]
MPRGEKGGYISKTSTNPVRQQGHSPLHQQAPTDSPQLPQTVQELGGNRQKASRKGSEARRKLQQLKEGIPHCREGGEDQDQGSGQARRPSLNPESPRGALSMDYVNLLEFKEQVKKEKLPARQF